MLLNKQTTTIKPY